MDRLDDRPPPWGCPACGSTSVGREDYQSGVYLVRGRFARLHAPRFLLRCFNPHCRHLAVIWPRPASPAGTPAARGS